MHALRHLVPVRVQQPGLRSWILPGEVTVGAIATAMQRLGRPPGQLAADAIPRRAASAIGVDWPPFSGTS